MTCLSPGAGSLAGACRRWVRRAHAVTMVEAVVAIAIVGLMLVAALRTVGAARVLEVRSSDSFKGALLAQSLMTEILAKPYSDPTASVTLGVDPGESTGTRAKFDDVDDYNGWDCTPPQQADGTQETNLSGWRTAVAVVWVDPYDPRKTSLLETGAKRITVTVQRRNGLAATLVAVRTRGT